MIDERCGAGVPHPRYLAVLSPPCSGHCGFITHSQIMTQEEEKGGRGEDQEGGGGGEIICTLEQSPMKFPVKEGNKKGGQCRNATREIM
jgi:hypothetical protein